MKLINKFNNISLKSRLILFFIMTSLMPTLVVGIVSYKISEGIILDKEINTTLRNLKDTDRKVFDYLSQKRSVAIRLSMDEHVIPLLGKKDNELAKSLKDEFEAKRLLNDYKNTEGTHSIYMFDKDGKAFTNDNSRLISYYSIVYKPWYTKMLLENISMWGDPRKLNDTYIIPFYRIALDNSSVKPVGIIMINILEDNIYKMFKEFEEPYSDIYVLNQNNKVSSSRNKLYLGSDFSDLYGVGVSLPGEKGYFVKNINNQKLLIAYYKNDILNWTFVCVESFKDILIASDSIKSITIILCLVCIFITSMISVFLSVKITKPVKKIIRLIKTVQQGDLDTKVVFISSDEFGLIGNAFNEMLGKIKQSIKEIYNIEQKKKEAEIKALLFQINPHFLYNTLSSIIWLTNSEKKKEVINMVSSLSTLFRISISKGKEIINLKEEIEHVKSYLIIQKIRYKEEFNYEFEIIGDITGYYTPKLLLQPLVENSIYHGVKEVEYSSLIKVRAFVENHNLAMEVIDNGKGMTDDEMEKVNKFLSGDLIDNDFGIGIRNVNERIKIYFGNEYGLSFKKEGNYTIAKIIIPIVNDPM